MIGQTVGHYRVLDHLGSGGMGDVYVAEDLRLGRSVALKFLAVQGDGAAQRRERFLREARAASRLDHPNICAVYEVDETAEGRMYIAMAHCEGETLKAGPRTRPSGARARGRDRRPGRGGAGRIPS